MQFVEAGGVRIPILGLGTWEMEGRDCSRAVEQALQAEEFPRNPMPISAGWGWFWFQLVAYQDPLNSSVKCA
jgi:hypothetical protein